MGGIQRFMEEVNDAIAESIDTKVVFEWLLQFHPDFFGGQYEKVKNLKSVSIFMNFLEFIKNCRDFL